MASQQSGRERPRDERGGTPLAFDIGCLTVEQRGLWDEWFPGLGEWTAADGICQVTILELWSFGYICMFELGEPPAVPPELDARLRDYGQKLTAYVSNRKKGSR